VPFFVFMRIYQVESILIILPLRNELWRKLELSLVLLLKSIAMLTRGIRMLNCASFQQNYFVEKHN